MVITRQHGLAQGRREPRPFKARLSCVTEKRLVTASAARRRRRLMACAAVVAAGTTARVTECGADGRRERQACKYAREYLAPGELHTSSLLSGRRFRRACSIPRDTPNQPPRLNALTGSSQGAGRFGRCE